MRAVVIQKSVPTAVRPSPRVCRTAAMFGLGVDEARRLHIVRRCEIPLPPGGIVFVTGPSGGGKSTILSLIAELCRRQDLAMIDFDALPPLPDVPLVDALEHLDLAGVTSLLGLVGLGDAFVMLRTPTQLSDGQRYRLRLAQTLDLARRHTTTNQPAIILADEFGATLDRLTATNIAAAIRRTLRGTEHTFVCATTHDDLLEPLDPDVLVVKNLGEHLEIHTR